MTLPILLRVLVDPIYLLLNFWIRIAWGIDLARAAQIGEGLYLCHYGGVLVSHRAVIGRNCNISHDVTIGIAGKGEGCGVPVIGNDVYIGPGAKLFGRIRIGNNVKIGANAVVHQDVPENSIVVLSPGFEVISSKGNRQAVKIAA